ncbi:Protein PROCA1 [Heterocephalus glaber]|uniref:Protein PROCA1 n=1 Tax=Heterocephalus glaber TaxID=10181 RepID=G5BVI1_HETGA|nr:Protein PROCA1 [Heterocephalus glaber]
MEKPTDNCSGGRSLCLQGWAAARPAANREDFVLMSITCECKESEGCCWKHKQYSGHIIHPFSDCGHHNLHLHAVSHCDCDSRCKSYRPVSVTVIHHPIHHECGTDDLNEEEEEEEGEEESKPSIPTQSPTGKSQGNKVIKKVKKKKENEKDKEEEMTDEKAKLKKKAKKGKLTKKKSPVKLEFSPADLSQSLSSRELAWMSESSSESRGDLESEDSYHNRRQQEPSSEGIMESSSPRKRETSTTQAKKNGTEPSSQAKKVTKRKPPPVSNPNLS